MFLNRIRLGFSGVNILWLVLIALCLSALILMIRPRRDSREQQAGCLLELPVYNSRGERQDFSVVRVEPHQHPDINLLERIPEHVRGEGSAVWFSSVTEVINQVLVVKLKDEAGRLASDKVFLAQCPQRHSIRVGVSEVGIGDVNGATVHGRLIGCKITKDWWVRAMPMFGSGLGPQVIFEGHIQSSGDFSISGGMDGERHIIVFGVGSQPLMAKGYDVTLAGVNSMGTLRISGKCGESP